MLLVKERLGGTGERSGKPGERFGQLNLGNGRMDGRSSGLDVPVKGLV